MFELVARVDFGVQININVTRRSEIDEEEKKTNINTIKFAPQTVQAPQVHLLNQTFVSVAQTPNELKQRPPTANRISLDCKVVGYPLPWVEWFRNGKMLRNKSNGKVRIRTHKQRRRHNVRFSRLELDLAPGNNETGIYECRAMSVAAREPVVGSYTLLVLPAQFALIPLHPRPQHEAELEEPTRPGEPSTTAPTSPPTPTSPAPLEATTEAAAVQMTSQTTTISPTTTTTTATVSTTSTTTTTTKRPTAQPAATLIESSSGNQAAAETSQQRPDSEGQPSRSGERRANEATKMAANGSNINYLPCPRDAHDNFCLNKGTCLLIGHINEYSCR